LTSDKVKQNPNLPSSGARKRETETAIGSALEAMILNHDGGF
jgi:hypothetical protein